MSPIFGPKKETDTMPSDPLRAVKFVFDPTTQSPEQQKLEIIAEINRLSELSPSEVHIGDIREQRKKVSGRHTVIHTTTFDPPLDLSDERAHDGILEAHNAFKQNRTAANQQTPMSQQDPEVPEYSPPRNLEDLGIFAITGALAAGSFSVSALLGTSSISNLAQLIGWSLTFICASTALICLRDWLSREE